MKQEPTEKGIIPQDQAVTTPALYSAEATELETFLRTLHRSPEPSSIRVNNMADDSEYLPISFVEMTLDEIYFGLWQTRNFTTKTIANELVGEIELWVFHPLAKCWLSRTGAAAVMIQFKKDSDITVLSNKIKNTLVKDYPHLKAACVTNAARSLGVVFGRDLNREHVDAYNPESETQTDRQFQVQEILSLFERRIVPEKIMSTMRTDYATMSSERLEKAIAYLKTCPVKEGGAE